MVEFGIMLEEQKPILAMGLVKHNGKILIIERANKEPGMAWAFPGGEVEPGETPDHTAQREVFEETGVKCENCRLIHERIHPVTKRHILYFACLRSKLLVLTESAIFRA